MPPSSEHDGYWLPAGLRDAVVRDAEWESVTIGGGDVWSAEAVGPARARPDAGAETPGVRVRWPRLTRRGWAELLGGLQRGRTLPTREALARWERALAETTERLGAQAASMLPVLADATGYPVEMLHTALGQGDLMAAAGLQHALSFAPTWSIASRWETMPGLVGRARFFPHTRSGRMRARATALAVSRDRALCLPARPTDLVTGFAAGNVPGTGVLITLLAGLANAAWAAEKAPAVLVRNSRHEPLFTPWVLSAVEAVDPELVAGTAALVWDYADHALQSDLMRQAGLMLAAAGDDTIAALDGVRAQAAPTLRFHRHGHKASLAVIATTTAPPGARSARPTDSRQASPPSVSAPATATSPDRAGGPDDPAQAAARLAALDSALWDQNGCLSARVHFVCGDAHAYGQALVDELRRLSTSIPRGSTPMRYTHRAFDMYVALSPSAPVEVCSTYADDFAVMVDRRPWDEAAIRRVVNACQGRTVVVRPVSEPLEAAALLRHLPAHNLQSVSLEVDDGVVEEFADQAGAAGVTAVRALGRAAFPKLAYSWDGLLPLDLAYVRPPGHFTTIEFDRLRGPHPACVPATGTS